MHEILSYGALEIVAEFGYVSNKFNFFIGGLRALNTNI
jgi:hypothetical protein